MAACILAVLLGLSPTAAEAQTTFISNTDQAHAGSRNLPVGGGLSQSFTTGTAANGEYRITRIVIESDNMIPAAGRSALTAEIRSNDSNGNPGTRVASLTVPTSVTTRAGNHNFDVTGGHVVLANNTTYHIVLELAASGDRFAWRYLQTANTDSATAGWSVGSASRTTGSAWAVITSPAGQRFQFQVIGRDVGPPPTITVRAINNDIAEGENAVWELRRTGDNSNSLTVEVGYTTHRAGQAENEFTSFIRRDVTFGSGSSTARHTENTDDNAVVEGRTVRLTVLSPAGDEYMRGEPFAATIAVAETDVEISIEPVTQYDVEGNAFFIRLIRTGNQGSEVPVLLRRTWSTGGEIESTWRVQAGNSSDEWDVSESSSDNAPGDDISLTVTVLPARSQDPVKYLIGEPSVVTMVRFDDDGAAGVPISVEPCDGADEVTEGSPARFRFTRHGSTSAGLDFGYEVSQPFTGSNNVLERFAAGSRENSYRETGTFATGVSTYCEDVPTRGDMTDEPDSTVRVTLDASGTGWRRGGFDSHVAEVTVPDDDLPTVTLEPTSPDFEESDGGPMFRATRVGSLVVPNTPGNQDGTPGLLVRTLYTGSDGEERAYSLSIPRGMQSGVGQPEFLTDNEEPAEPYQVSIRVVESTLSAHQYIIGNPSSATVTIYDKDGAPVLSAAPVDDEVTEGDMLTWELTREGGDTTAEFEIDYTIRLDSEDNPLDGDTYTLTGTATFAARATTTTVSLDTDDDNVGEPDGGVSLRLARTPTFAWDVEDTLAEEAAATRINVLDDDPWPPANLFARIGPESIVLNWDTPTDTAGAAITGYRIERSDDGSTGWTDLVANTGNTDTTYTHRGLAEDQVVHYRVSTITASTTSVASSVVSGTAGGMGLAAPTGLMAMDGILSIRLDWTAPAGATGIQGYRIERSDDGSTGWTVLVENTERTSTFYSNVGLSAGDTVHYRVRTVDASGLAGAASSTASATAQALPSGQRTATVLAEEASVVGDGVNEVVFIINTSGGHLESQYSITGQAAITGSTAQGSPEDVATFVQGEQHRIQTVALAPGSAPIDVTLTFITGAASTGVSDSNHAFTVGSATVRVTAPSARRENPVLFRSTARGTDRNTDEIAADRWYSQPFTLAGNTPGYAGYDIDSVVLLIRTTNGQPVSSTSALVTLRTDDGSDNPSDTVLATMQHPSMIRHGRLATFPAPTAGIRLDAGTKYHVVVHVPAGGADSGIRWLGSGAGARAGFDVARIHRGSSWAPEGATVMMLQVRGSEAVDPNVPEITVRAEADTVLGDGLNFVRFFLVRSGSFPQRRVQYTLTESAALNDALETNTEATYTYSGSGTSELIRVRTGNLTPGGDPIDVIFNLLPGTGYRVGDPGSKTVTVTPLPAPLLVGNQEAVREALAVVRRDRDYAQKFTTGSNNGGYTLDAVVVSTGTDPLRSGYDPSVPVIMTIRGEDPSGNPASAVVGTLTEPATIIDGRNAFTAQGTIELDADTSYYVVISQDVPASTGGIPLDGPQPALNAFDSDSLAGWSIEDRLLWNQGGSWGAAGGGGSSRALTIRLAGEEVEVAAPAPEVTVAATPPSIVGRGASNAVFTLTRTGDTAAALTVGVAVTGDGRSSPANSPTEATFTAGSATAEVAVPTNGLGEGDASESVTLTLQPGAGYTVGASPGDAATVTVTAPINTPATGMPSVTGTARVGEELTAGIGNIMDSDSQPTELELRWQWQRETRADTWEDIEGETSQAYTLADADEGLRVRVRADFRDRITQILETLFSLPTAAVRAAAGGTPGTMTAPGAPTGLTATAGELSIRLSWTAPASDGGAAITGYRIERATGDCSGTPNFMERVANTGSTAVTRTDSGLAEGETWCYRVSAINSVDTGAPSNTAGATVPVDSAPDFGSETIDDQQWRIDTAVTLNLPTATGGEGDLSYTLEPALPNGVTLNGAPACSGSAGCSISGTPVGMSAVRQDESYTWRVSDADGNTADSDADTLTFEITVAAVVPGAPTGLTATSGAFSIRLRWTAPSSDGGSAITGYFIERARGDCSGTPSFMALVANTDSTAVTRTDSGLTEDDVWCYRVSAINAVDTGAASNTDSATVLAVSEEQVHKATEATLALLAPNVASGAIQVLTSRFDSFGAPGAQGAARNTAMLGGRPLGSFANESASGLDVAREVASFFGVSLPHVRAGYGRGGDGYGGAAMRGGPGGGYGAAGGPGAGDGVGYGGAAVSGGGYGAVDGAAIGNAGGASAELAFAPAVQGELEAQARQRNTEGRGANEASDWRRQDLGAWLGVGDLQSPDLKSLLPQSSFSVTLGAANGAADDPGGAGGGIFSGRWTVWGQGAAGGFEGREKDTGLSVEGDSISAYLGADVQRGNLALGLAVGQSSGDMDYDQGDEGSGSLETELTSLHPYLNWSPNPELSLYLVLGYGVGEADLDVENLPTTLNTDLEMLMLAFGGRRALASDAAGRRYDVKVDAFLTELETDGAQASGDMDFNWRAADAQSSRLRAALAASAPLPVGPANSLVAEGELAARLDGGDAQTGVGAELGAGLRWRRGGFSLAARGRLLLVHSENDYEDYKEWGASLTASYDAGQAGRGFRATLSPVWGDAGSDAGALYEGAGALRDVGGGAGVRRSGLLPDRLAFEFGYGMGLLGGRALLLPFGSFSFAGGGDASSDTQLRLGTRVDLSRALGVVGGGGEFSVQRLGFELFGETQAGADREQRFGLDLKLGF